MQAVPAHRLASLLGPWRGQGPAYRDLADAMRVLVIDARLPDGVRLPSERLLAEALDVSRTTTTRAYEELRTRGLLESRRGSGSVVVVPLADSSASAVLEPDSSAGWISLGQAAPQAAPGLGQVFERALQLMPAALTTNGYLPDGYQPLRERIAARYADQGLPTDPGQIMITTGAQGALSIIAATLMRPGDRVLAEACGYPHSYETVAGAGAHVVPLPHGDTPWDVADIRLAAPAAGIAMFVPDFHNPTGSVMTGSEREAIARALRRAGVTTIVDETIRDMHLDGPAPPPPYATFDPDAITIGSFSKCIWGGLRLGWIRAPHHLVSNLLQTRMRVDLGTATFEQVVACEALDAGLLPAHLNELRLRRDFLFTALARQLPEFAVRAPGGGLSLWAKLPIRASSRLVAAALDQQLQLLPGPRFFASRGATGEDYLRLPYTLPPEALGDAVGRLAAAWRTVEGGGGSGSADSARELDLIA